jgi:integrase
MKLTQKTINALAVPRGKSECIVFDEDLPGFGLRLRRGGARTWVYQFKIGTQHRRMTLGSVSAITPAQARRTANDLHAKVRLGQDPAGEKIEGRARAAETMGALLKPYLEQKRASITGGSYKNVERHLDKHCRSLHGLRLAKIDRRAVAAVLAGIASTRPVEANRVRASLSAFFAWCIGEGFLDHNSVVGTGRRDERSRERVLSDAELKAIWNATAGQDDYSAVVRLLMLTGARVAEIGSLSRSEIVGQAIVVPGSRTKNKRPHTIPTSAPARSILEAQLRRHNRDFLFGRRPNRPLTGWSALKASLDRRIGPAVADWTHHDLRRTFATRLAELNVAPHLIEALLNHVSGHKHGVAGVYNRADYEAQKRSALNLWADHLMAAVSSPEAPRPRRGA